jgi:hypothetical protein
MVNPLFSTYSQGENRVTASILAVFERLSFGLVERLLQALCQEPETALLTFTNQLVGPASVPDGRIRASFSNWLETKVVPDAVRYDQLRGHLMALDGEANVERQRLLVLTPDSKPPAELSALNDTRVAWASFDDLVAAIRDVTEVGSAWLTSDRPLATEQERSLLRELVRLLLVAGLVGGRGKRVLVVAARLALPEYLRHSAYMCQPHRTFQPAARMAFYANGVIHRRVPAILEQVEAIALSAEAILARDDLSESLRERLLNLVAELTAEGSYRLGRTEKVIFLSDPDAPATLALPHDIKNDLVADSGRPVAFTPGQRYVSLVRLEKGPKTTTELLAE